MFNSNEVANQPKENAAHDQQAAPLNIEFDYNDYDGISQAEHEAFFNQPLDAYADEMQFFADTGYETDLTDETISLSNTEFLTAIFGGTDEDCKPMIVSVQGKLDDISFKKSGKGKPWVKDESQYPAENNNYFSLAAFQADDFGNYHRQKKHFHSLHCIMLDDIGTKIPLENIMLPPSWAIETSEGNYQYGYILELPITDIALVDKLCKAIIARGLSDKGAGGFTARLARLPVAHNTKRESAFNCRLRIWEPDRKYSVDSMIVVLALDMNPTKGKAKKGGSKASAASEEIYRPKPLTNPVIESLKTRGLYKNDSGGGKHEITCPWVEEHTDGIDGGTAYFEPSENFAVGGFKCFHGHGDSKKISELLEFLELDFTTAKMKPLIRIITGELHRIADIAENELAITGQYYQRGGLIVTILKEPSTKEISIKPLTSPALIYAFSKYIAWEGYDGRSDSYVVKDPPNKVVNVVFDAAKYDHLPIIKSIAHQPFLRDDYSLVKQRGYDAASEMYGEFNPKHFNIPLNPTKRDAEIALKKLVALLEDFGFACESDKSAALSAILTAAVRPSLAVAPMFHVRAPMIGSGKSFLCQIIAAFATERLGAPVAFPSEEEECRKLLFSEFLRAPAVIEFDNLTTDLKAHKSLCTALTSEYLSDRILGVSKTATVCTRSLILSSGNNVSPINDMVRRCITINLDTGCEVPFARTYKNPNLLQDLQIKRAEYISAAFTIILAWLSANEPAPECKPFVTYGEWGKLCRYPLLWLGYSDPVASVFQTMNDDPETETLQALLREWYASFDNKPMMIRQALDSFHNASTELREIFHDIAGERDTINRKRLGHYIKRHQNRIIDGLRFVKAAGNYSAAAWKVESVSSELSVLSGDSEKTVNEVVL